MLIVYQYNTHHAPFTFEPYCTCDGYTKHRPYRKWMHVFPGPDLLCDPDSLNLTARDREFCCPLPQILLRQGCCGVARQRFRRRRGG